MSQAFLANLLFETADDRVLLNALPIMLGVLCALAIAYRYYSAFLAARVAMLDDSRPTPAHRLNDGQNYHPTNKWVLFGHHFAAISGAGPLIGPVLGLQYGYAPGLLWLLIGVVFAGAVQDMLVLAASVRRDGKSLAEIARQELGRPAAIIVSVAILFIVIVALAGLGIVVVRALGGTTAKLPPGTRITLKPGAELEGEAGRYTIPADARVSYPGQQDDEAVEWAWAFAVQVPLTDRDGNELPPLRAVDGVVKLPDGTEQIIPGSSWGTFTIACTIPIALLVGWYMYRFRKGRVLEASLIGAVGVVAATIAGSLIPDSPLHHVFALTQNQTTAALMTYGFIASVLPVWLLLCPRDYVSSFLKIGTIALLVVGLLMANPTLKAPPLNEKYLGGGPTMKGPIFPFLFICIMCGAISGFHALVSSGTTPKMIDRERDIRPIGYGAMLMEGLVGIVALLAAAALEPERHYFQINTPLAEQYKQAEEKSGEKKLRTDPLHQVGVRDPHQLRVAERDLSELERLVGEPVRGRTGGAVTLAVGMAVIFTDALHWTGLAVEGIIKYWYHFAIMFEALFILTTIDTGTRIGRFLMQETLLKWIHPKFEETDWVPGATVATLLVTLGWGTLVWTGEVSTIWPMFGIANQLLGVLALALVTTWLINTGRARYVPVTLLPMLFVTTTTMTAGAEMIGYQFPAMIAAGKSFKDKLTGYLSITFAVFIITLVALLLLLAVARWVAVLRGFIPVRDREVE